MSTHVLTTMLSVVSVLVMQASPVLGQSVQEPTKMSKSLLEIRLARGGDAPGYERATMARSGDVLYVRNEALFTTEDFEHVEARATPTGLVLRARWNPTAAQRMAVVQRGEVGSGNEFLAVFIDGELVNAARIVADPHAVATPKIDIAVPASSDRAERIAAAVASRWPKG